MMKESPIEGRASMPDRRVLLAFVLATILAGANGVAVRFTVKELAPFWGAAMRFSAATVILWLIVLVRRSRLPRGSELIGYLLYGAVAFGIAYAFLYWGFKSVTAGMGQVILALTPLLTFFFALLHRLESFRWRGLAGALIALAGIALAFLEGGASSAPILPVLAMIGGAACFAESNILVKRLHDPDPFVANAIGMGTGAAMLLLLSRLLGEAWRLPTRPATWTSVGYLVAVGSVIVFSLSVFVLRHWTASASSYQLVLMPFVSVVLGSLLAGEMFGPGLLIGGVLVLLGVWVGALAAPARQPQPNTMVAAAGEAD